MKQRPDLRRLWAACPWRLAVLLVLALELIFLAAGLVQDRRVAARSPVVTVLADRMKPMLESDKMSQDTSGFTVEEGLSGDVVTTDWMVLTRGMYNVSVAYYGGGSDVNISFHQADIEAGHITLPEGRRAVTFQAFVPADQSEATLRIATGGSGIKLESIVLQPSQTYGWYRLLCRLAAFAAVDALLLVCWRRVPLPGGGAGRATALALGGITVLACLPLFTSNVVAGHDLLFHLNRIEGLARGIASGQLPVRIQPFWLSGNGYAAGVFYGDLFLYFPAALRLLGVPVQAAYKAFVFAVTLGTAVLTWWCVRRMLRDNAAALAASGLYTLSAYRMVDVYTRGAVGEYTALLFLPLVAYGLWRIFSQEDGAKPARLVWLPAAIGYTGLIQSHLLTGEMTGFLTILVCLALWRRTLRANTFWPLAKVVAAMLLANAWFLVPLFDYLSRGSFAVGGISQYAGIQTMAAFPAQLFGLVFNGDTELLNLASDQGTVNEMAFGMGTAVLLCALLFLGASFLLEPRQDPRWKLGRGGLWLGALCAWMATTWFPWNALCDLHPLIDRLAQTLQYPWRWGGPATLLWVLAGACALALLRARPSWRMAAAGVLAALCLVSWGSLTESVLDAKELVNYYSAAALDSNEISGGEYLPAGADEYTVASSLEPFAQGAEISAWTQSDLRATVTAASETGGTVTVPILCYPYYQAQDETGAALAVAPDPVTQQVCVTLPAGYAGTFTVSFREPWHWRAAEAVSLVSLAALALWAGVTARRKKPVPA